MKVDAINKGCSMFAFDRHDDCSIITGGTISCKNMCTESFCNTGGMDSNDVPKVPLKCHQCQEIFDHMGNPVQPETQDQNCYNLTDDSHLDYCSPGATHCATTLK